MHPILSYTYSNIYIPTHAHIQKWQIERKGPKKPIREIQLRFPKKKVCLCLCVLCVCVLLRFPKKTVFLYVCVFLCLCLSLCNIKAREIQLRVPEKRCVCVSVCLCVCVCNFSACEILLPKEEGAYMRVYTYTCIHVYIFCIVAIWGGQTSTSRTQVVIQTSQTHTSCRWAACIVLRREPSKCYQLNKSSKHPHHELN